MTIEGLADDGELHPMQAAFREHHGLQCGYCTPGMIMSAVDIVNRKGADLDEQTIRAELEGNLCRCTGYHNIVKAVAAGAKRWRRAVSRPPNRAGPPPAACRHGRRPARTNQINERILDDQSPDLRKQELTPSSTCAARGQNATKRITMTPQGSARQCAARKTTVSSPARGATSTISIGLARPMPISCARRMLMPTIRSIERVKAARAMPGVVAIFTGEISPPTRSEASFAAG